MRRFLRGAVAAWFVLAMPGLALAESNVSVDHGTVWQTVKIGDSTQGFIEIHNSGDQSDVLTSWDCSIADTTTLVDANGKPLTSLNIPAGATVTLAPGGMHLVLQNLHYTVDRGSILPCSLTFQGAGVLGGYLGAVPAPSN